MGKTARVLDKEFELYISEDRIRQRIRELAEEMNGDLGMLNPVFLSVLNGSLFFTADLLRELDFPCEVSFVKISSYKGLSSSGTVKTLLGPDKELSGRHIVVLEDIVDTGQTVKDLGAQLMELQPASLRMASLLLKPQALQWPVEMDYVGFEVPNLFLIGYGLDYNGQGRMLKDIYILKN